jgi:hypothetical protein
MKRLLIIALSAGLLLPMLSQAAELNITTAIDAATLEIGYTVVNSAGTAWVGIPAKAVRQTERLRVKLSPVAHPENYYGDEQPISDLYRFSLHAAEGFKLKKALHLKLSYPSSYHDRTVVMKYYDSAKDRWRVLDDQSDHSSALTHSAHLKKKQAIIALFEKPAEGDVVQGVASWYYGTGAACNSFPMGSRIRVTNIDTGAYVDTTIVSSGPFVPGRVVDLTDSDFAQIASLSAGVVNVTVQAIE